jgi:hypothetical protein
MVRKFCAQDEVPFLIEYLIPLNPGTLLAVEIII